MNSSLQEAALSGKCPHKKTDFRRELWLRQRKMLRQKAKKKSFAVKQTTARVPKTSVTVDTSKARSNADIVRLCLQELKWKEYPYGKKEGVPCDIYWHGTDFGDGAELPSGKINKFPGMISLVRKISLTRTLDTMKILFPDEFDFYPQSWFLPQQYSEFFNHILKVNEKRPKNKPKPYFIVKPDEGAQGDGIYLINDPNSYLMTERNHIVQQYMHNPLLIDGLKFDLRVYVTVMSIDPVEIYISKEGLVRFCTVPYESPTTKNMHESYMHLTNYSLNKKSSSYIHTDSTEDGSKRTLSSVLQELAYMGYDSTRLWVNIEKLVLKTILAIVPELKVVFRAEVPPMRVGPSCFQILGFDILLLDDGKPVLLEVNASPSLRIDYENEIGLGIYEYIHSPVDEEIKKPVVMDTLLLAAPRNKLMKAKRRCSLKPKTDDSKESDSEDDRVEEEDSFPKLCCLEQIFPAHYGHEYQWLRIMERASNIFMACLGVRGTLKMGSTSFRTFTRKCNLSSCGMSNAAVDIMYIDMSRKWEHMNACGTTGLCYQGFLEAFFILAKKKFPSSGCRLDAVERLIEYCETQIENDKARSGSVLPRLTREEKKMEQLQEAYGTMFIRKKPSYRTNDFCLDYRHFKVEKKDRVVVDKKNHSLQKENSVTDNMPSGAVQNQ